MRIGVLGTGIVGRSHAARLVDLGHEVVMGTRDVSRSLSVNTVDYMGNPPLREWLDRNPQVRLTPFSEAAKHGEIVINAINGMHALEGLHLAGNENLDGKVIIDITNPLDFSRGMPPSLFISNTDSLGEQIQRSFPSARIVKTLNTMSAPLQVNPRLLMDGDHHTFISGNDPEAKRVVVQLLEDYGWRNVIDIGDIASARGPEMVLPIWTRLLGVLKTPMFNFKLVYER
jgi:8-hydroxy-5-deazaflavin:NADPH oxidoreductase